MKNSKKRAGKSGANQHEAKKTRFTTDKAIAAAISKGIAEKYKEIEAENNERADSITPKQFKAELAVIELKLEKAEKRYKELTTSAKRLGQISSTHCLPETSNKNSRRS
jgi:hypothetical protein